MIEHVPSQFPTPQTGTDELALLFNEVHLESVFLFGLALWTAFGDSVCFPLIFQLASKSNEPNGVWVPRHCHADCVS